MRQVVIVVILIFTFVFLSFGTFSQRNKDKNKKSHQRVYTVFGAQVSPMIPASFVHENPVYIDHDTANYTFRQRAGVLVGMEIRFDYTKWLALKVGINLMKRNYEFETEYQGVTQKEKLGLLCYETPLSVLIYAKLSKKFYMHNSFGLNLSYYPSDLTLPGVLTAYRSTWISPSLLANVGFEFRTEKYGYFYLGASYNIMFFDIYNIAAQSAGGSINEFFLFSERGNYFMINLKYFLQPKVKPQWND